ncbi:peptidoglycan recognition protein family protein [Micromonospora inyonensis]|uniref:N-acetylmuramoyl-L-alanine amidase n=1 Tax=Micromonospora inyonensis TaxID=47866 RepID=A0A1C6RWD1_9ACTN|nr:peptidoglycan recognition family protein [Micromonospora inyonensis]SCL21516.1 N-acetylmuramoyl-L-alanine amidase [Micromonospora inyonensis]SCL21740.1 N-acetylmuramoyl-L-alanine amidase [Micromonospora inyonensis]
MIVSGVRYVAGRNAYSDRDSTKCGIAIHNTSNDASAEQEASYATRRTDEVSAHFYVDADSVIQSLDTRARAGHAGSSTGNENAIAVEITGVNGWTREQWLQRVAWDRLAQVLAVVCREYDIAPRRATVVEMTSNPRVRAFYGHDDMRRAWGGTTHTDPGPNFPWDHLLTKVQHALAGEDDDMPSADEVAAEVWSQPYRDYNLPPVDGKPAVRPTSAILLDARTDAARTRAEVTALRSEVRALIDAQQGVDGRAILARLDEHAQAERERDEAAARRDADLLALVQQGQDGTLDAAEVLRRMGELLATAGQGQARE